MICMKNHGLLVDCFRQVKLVLQVRSNLSPTISSVRLQLANKSWPHCMIIKHNQLSIFIRAWSVISERQSLQVRDLIKCAQYDDKGRMSGPVYPVIYSA